MILTATGQNLITINGKRPKTWDASLNSPAAASGSNLSGLDFKYFLGVHDRDHPRLHHLRDLADEVDVQESVLQIRTSYFDIVGQLKAALEVAGGDASVEQLTSLLVVHLLLAADCQCVFLRLD